jgi:hypothetical protein
MTTVEWFKEFFEPFEITKIENGLDKQEISCRCNLTAVCVKKGIAVVLRTCSCFPYILPDSSSSTVAHNKFVMQRLVKLKLTAIDDKPDREKVCALDRIQYR